MIAKHKGEIPVVVLLLPFLIGISCGLLLPNNSPFTFVALVSLTLLFVGLNICYTPLKIYKQRWLGGILIHFITFLFGLFITTRHNELNNADHFSKKQSQHLAVVITSEPKVKDDLVRFTADVKLVINNGQATKTSGTLLITIKDGLAKNLFYGEELLIPSKFAPIDPPFNPAEFNYKKYLANRNVHLQSFLFPGQYKVLASGKANPIIAYALLTRQNLVEKLKRNMQDTTATAIASTLILGYKADLSNEVLQAYSKTGTIHILSVSGGHVAIIYLLLSWTLRFMNGFKRGEILKAIISITLIWAYALLTGFSPAVCRAALMITLVITGKTYSRYINNLNLLAVSAFMLLIYDPYLITDVGFQLSYLAVGGLIVFQPMVYNWFTFQNRVANKLWLICSVSIAAQVITFPLSAYYFHQFPVYFLLSNLLIILPISIIMYSGLALLILPQIPYLSKALGFVLERSILIMNKALSVIEHSPYASINKIWLNVPEYLLLYAIITLAFYFIYSNKKWIIKATLFCILTLGISIGVKKISTDNTQSITFLNLRKHKGIVFKNGQQGVVITDLPKDEMNFQYSIQPYLDSSRTTNYKIYDMNAVVHTPYLIKQGGLVWFESKKLLLLNDGSKLQSIPKRIVVDYVYLSDNAALNSNLSTKALIVTDGSNSNEYIYMLKKRADYTGLNFYVLKRNKSISILSNP